MVLLPLMNLPSIQQAPFCSSEENMFSRTNALTDTQTDIQTDTKTYIQTDRQTINESKIHLLSLNTIETF